MHDHGVTGRTGTEPADNPVDREGRCSAIGPPCADAHDGQRRMMLHNRPDIRLHPILINATIVYFLADIREESIYGRLATHSYDFSGP